MNPSSDFPWAEEWGVTAAPFILNLQDSPAAEDFNGTSMVRRRSHTHSQALACLRVHVLLWPDYSPAIRPMHASASDLQSSDGPISGPC